MVWAKLRSGILAMGVLAVASFAHASGGSEVTVALGSIGKVELEVEYESSGTALEVEVEIDDGVAGADCQASVDAGGASVNLGSFTTNSLGNGKIERKISLGDQVGDIQVTVTVECSFIDPDTGMLVDEVLTATATVNVSATPPGDDDDDDEAEDDDDDDDDDNSNQNQNKIKKQKKNKKQKRNRRRR